MAQSRLERIGTIFTRTKSLLRGGAMKEEDKPLWYAIYEAFPPKVEPRYGRAAPKIPIRKIFYKEDAIRAKFQKDYNRFSVTSMNTKVPSRTQKFISIYDALEKSGVPEEELYTKAIEVYTQEMGVQAVEFAEPKERNNKEYRKEKFSEYKTREYNKPEQTVVKPVKAQNLVDLKKVFTD